MLLKNYKTNFKTLIICLIAVGLFLLSACTSQKDNDINSNKLDLQSRLDDLELMENDSLNVATSPDYPPYEYDENGEIKGFDIEIGRMIADSLGLNYELIPYIYNDVLFDDTLKGTKFDVIISAAAKSEYKSKYVNFSNPYIKQDETMLFLAKKDSNISEGDFNALINGKIKVASFEIGSFKDKLYDMYPNVDVVLVNTYEELTNCLDTGQASLILVDDDFYDIVGNADSYKVVKSIDFVEEICVAISKSKPNLLSAINEVIDKRLADGTIDEIQKKYDFKKGIYEN